MRALFGGFAWRTQIFDMKRLYLPFYHYRIVIFCALCMIGPATIPIGRLALWNSFCRLRAKSFWGHFPTLTQSQTLVNDSNCHGS
jgi:hypothetical protein